MPILCWAIEPRFSGHHHAQCLCLGQKRLYMTDHINAISRTFKYYASSLGLLMLTAAIKLFNYLFGLEQETMRIFGLVVYVEYLSAMIGVLYLLFIATLALQLRQLRELVDRSMGQTTEDRMEIKQLFLCHPWLASPFHGVGAGRSLFWGMIAVGLLVVAWVTFVHLGGWLETSRPVAFRAIGLLNLIVLLLVAPMLRMMARTVEKIRAQIHPLHVDVRQIGETQLM